MPLGSKQDFAELGWNLDALPCDIYTPMHIITHIFHQGGEHLFPWDFETMELMLRRAGFSDIRQRRFRESADPEFTVDLEVHKSYSLIVEAIKWGSEIRSEGVEFACIVHTPSWRHAAAVPTSPAQIICSLKGSHDRHALG